MEQIDKLKEAIVTIGFSEDTAKKQLNEMSEIITMAILKRLMDEKNISIDELNTAEDFQKAFSSNYTKEELEKIIKEEAGKIFYKYFSRILIKCNEETLKKVESIVGEPEKEF